MVVWKQIRYTYFHFQAHRVFLWKCIQQKYFFHQIWTRGTAILFHSVPMKSRQVGLWHIWHLGPTQWACSWRHRNRLTARHRCQLPARHRRQVPGTGADCPTQIQHRHRLSDTNTGIARLGQTQAARHKPECRLPDTGTDWPARHRDRHKHGYSLQCTNKGC